MIEYIFGYLDLKKGVTYKLDNFNRTPIPSDPYTISFAFEDSNTSIPEHNLDYTVLSFTHGDTKGYIWIDKRTHLASKIIGISKSSNYTIIKL